MHYYVVTLELNAGSELFDKFSIYMLTFLNRSVPGWNCGPHYFSRSVLKTFATSQVLTIFKYFCQLKVSNVRVSVCASYFEQLKMICFGYFHDETD
jgi:hypothetical protein